MTDHQMQKFVFVLLAGLLASTPTRLAAQSTDLGGYALFAVEGLRAKGLRVRGGGDVGVNDVEGTLRVHGRLDAPSSEIAADSVRTLSAAFCESLFSNSPNPAICGLQNSFHAPFPNLADLLAACGYPDPFPSCGGPAIVVERAQTVVITPGSYGDVFVKGSPNAGTLIFDGVGDYNLCSLIAGRHADLLFRSAVPGRVNVSVMGDVGDVGRDPELANGTFTGPEAGSALSVADIHIYAKGGAVHFSRRSKVQANLCAPNATLFVTQGAHLTGTFVANRIQTETVTVMSGPTTPSTTTTTTPLTTTTTLPVTTTTTTPTTTTTAPPVCEQGHCGNGVVEPECEESCDCGMEQTSCSGVSILSPPDSPECRLCTNCHIDDSGCTTTTTTTTMAPTTTTAEGASTTTTTTPEGTSTTTTTVPSACGNGVLDPGEQCDGSQFAVAGCPVGSPNGALLCTSTCTIDTTSCRPLQIVEICGNCLDDDGNGLTDFEDPACVGQGQAYGMQRVRTKLKPRGAKTRFQIQSRLANSGLGQLINPRRNGQDVYVQIRATNATTDLLCAKIPSKKFMTMSRCFMFWDRRGKVKEAQGLQDMTICRRKGGRVTLRTHGPRVSFQTPGKPTPLNVTVAFFNPVAGNTATRCSTVIQLGVRSGKRGALLAP